MPAGDNQMFQGRILAYDAAKPQQHLVLWDDGEHEWIDVSQEQLTWHAGDRGQNPGFGAGLPAGKLFAPHIITSQSRGVIFKTDDSLVETRAYWRQLSIVSSVFISKSGTTSHPG